MAVTGGLGMFLEDNARWISWYQWKAEALNRLFRQQGRTGEPGNIIAETVLHGETPQAE